MRGSYEGIIMMKDKEKFKIQPITNKNREKVNQIMINEWNDLFMVVRGNVIKLDEVDGLIAYDEKEIVGIITYIVCRNIIEIISLNSFKERKGAGTFLIQKLKEKAKNENICVIKLITTNDNINAIKFYQKRNFVISNIYINSIKKAREIKPNIPKKRKFWNSN
jgi:ribosomal protein S18 acetylase RimI-like enzyme